MLLSVLLSLVFFWPQQAGTAVKPLPSAVPKVSNADIAQFRAKAESGDAGAQLELGMAYEEGQGVKQDYGESVKWYRRAADQGNAEAQNDLGIMYWNGRGVEKDKQQAVQWYLRAARQKHPSALFNVAAAYYNGEGVPATDYVRAYAWFLLAEEAGSKYAKDGVQRLESSMKLNGVEDGLMLLGSMFEKGEDVNLDYSQAAKWYRKAADRNYAPAQLHLAQMLIEGREIPQDYAQARQWCEAAAKRSAEGVTCVARFYHQGWGVEKDLRKAAKLFERAARDGDGDAMFQLSEMYWTGAGVKQDKIVGYMWSLLAFSARQPEAGDRAVMYRSQLSDKQQQSGQTKAENFLRTRPLYHLRIPVASGDSNRRN